MRSTLNMTGPGAIHRRVLVSMVVVLGLLAPASAQASAPRDYYGLSVQTLFNVVPSASWPAYLQPMADGGLTIGRVVANWSAAEPKPPNASGHHYSWASMDKLVSVLAARGVRMYDVIAMAPDWALSPNLAAHYSDLAAFAGAFAARYGTGGSFWLAHPELPYLPEIDFEFWTEANSTHFWEGAPNAAEYMKAFTLVRNAIHQAVPTARVMASIGWQDFSNFVAQLYANGAKGVI
ncbi:MAG: polysaccharide biosynthesis protein PslG, partial [Solirubrobacteraceae bacterium]|nr:polysaccharide biosynthesis protein PslG [Solirubrobacteraceae bacterium]